MFPTALSYKAYIDRGEVAYQQLLDMIASEGVALLDLHKPVHDYLGSRKICDLLTNRTDCNGHFNPEGNVLVADIIYRKINKEGLLQSK